MSQSTRRRIATLTAVAAVAVAGCSPGPPTPETPALAPPPPGAERPTLIEPTRPPPPAVHPVTAADLGETWRPGCPVAPQDLRRVDLDYLAPDGSTGRGALVVHRDVVDDVIAIFGRLRELRYPIARMRTVDNYPGAADELSMRDNNTSGFNCRPLGDGWSLHAYGRAIDVNPLVNPFVDSRGNLEPATARAYLDRTRDVPGMLRAGDAAVAAFTDRGWRWGGAWRDPIDYQHFEIG